MDKSISFAFGIHNHQPVGNFQGTFEFAYNSAYKPFLEALERHPGVKLSMHYTGILWDWFEKNQPQFIDQIGALAAKGQLELMTGGHFEPIFPILPDVDKVGQVRKLTEYIQRRFGCTPVGLWPAERVWEPQLAKSLVEAGVKYIIVDDSHFRSAGFKPEQLYGYYITEDDGRPLAVFPINKDLRYLIPFKPPEKTIDFLRSLATPYGERLLVMADDGEKFGVWPETYHSVYEEGWLEQFFTLLEQNADWLKLVTFSEHLAHQRAWGNAYLPTASYTEMMEWVLPAESCRKLEALRKTAERRDDQDLLVFLRGGFWRNFLVKYAETNNMHKKMLLVSQKVHQLPAAKRQAALDRLWAGQCNCAYWHGVFGGLYLNHLRTAIYENLIAAEKLTDKKKKGWVEACQCDFLCDGGETVMLSNADMNAYFSASEGGMLFEWDIKRKNFNLLNTLTRREEAYHQSLREMVAKTVAVVPHEKGETATIHDILRAKEEGLEKYLKYDWHRRSANILHFLGEKTTLFAFRWVEYEEQGDFANQPYHAHWEETSAGVTLELVRDGHIFRDAQVFPITVRELITFPSTGSTLEFEYTVTNQSEEKLPLWLALEYGFALQAGNTPDRFYMMPTHEARPMLGTAGEVDGADWLALVEGWLGLEVKVQLEQPTNWWHFPIETVSNSEGGFERVYQSSIVMPHWKFELEPGQSWQQKVRLEALDYQP